MLLADVDNAAQVESAVDELIAVQGRLDTVVSSAGITLTSKQKAPSRQ